jgi:hypothetical protein
MFLHIFVGICIGNMRKDSKIENEILQSSNLNIAQIIFIEIVPQ